MKTIRLAAIGDLLFTTPPGLQESGRGCEAFSEEIIDIFSSSDVVLANLECSLPGNRRVPTEPRVTATTDQLASLKNTHIALVSLANNHTFDYFDEGYQNTTTLLNQLGIGHFGAGRTLREAMEPAYFAKHGIRIAFIGAVSKSTGMKAMATPSDPGVVPLDLEKLVPFIRRLKQKVDHVVLSVHWGKERFRIPSPEQVQHCQALIQAGVSIILGHHPHVPQGVQYDASRSAVFFSLGNAIANPVYFDNGDAITWNRLERTGCLALIELDAERIHSIKQLPTYDDGCSVCLDRSAWASKIFSSLNNRVRRGVTPGAYRRETIRVQIIRPFVFHLASPHRKELVPKILKKARDWMHKPRLQNIGNG